MNAFDPAEQVLRNLGVTRPSEIDIEAIAWSLGAEVRYSRLESCEARILGYRDRAIIRIDPRPSLKRQRYSIGHELGHWRWHRGKSLVCRPDESRSYLGNRSSAELLADQFSADLLMPHYLFDPEMKKLRTLTVQAIDLLAADYKTSLTATAKRAVESRHSHAFLVSHNQSGRRWFARSPGVPEKWFPANDLDPESCAFEMLFGKTQTMAHPRKIGADAWFDRRDASRFELKEQSFRVGDAEVLTILNITDAAMLDE